MTYAYLRSTPAEPLTDLFDRMESMPTRTLTLSPEQVHVNVPEHVIDLNGTQIPLDADGLRALGDNLEIPNAFLLRQRTGLQQIIVETLLRQEREAATYAFSEDGLYEVRGANIEVVDPRRLLEVASRVVHPEAMVRDFWSTGSEFRLDVFAPEGAERGIGGDLAVNDLSAAGIRIIQDRKHNLAPGVVPFQYRLVCTNGMSTQFLGDRVDARGQSVDEILAEFEALAEIAFTQAEQDIASFYEMRTETVTNPERTLLRLASDADLPDRTITALLGRVPAMLDEMAGEQPSTFDLLNLMTNQANDPTQRRSGYRLRLEQAAGSIVTEHAERCSHCQARLVH